MDRFILEKIDAKNTNSVFKRTQINNRLERVVARPAQAKLFALKKRRKEIINAPKSGSKTILSLRSPDSQKTVRTVRF